MASVGGPLDFPEPKAREWFARMVDPGGPANCYCLIFTQDDTPIGEISFHRWDPKERSAGLNVKVLATHRGHGYARDALLTFLALFFGRVGGRMMTDDVAVDNQPGQHLLCSLGFDRDDGVADVCKMVMTKQMYVTRYGEPNKTLGATRTTHAPQG
jgi:RimJ/RimL family protein N-acetyltransferase